MKRFLSYGFTYLLVTIFLLVVTGSIWYIVNGANLSDSVTQVQAEVLSADSPYAVKDLLRGTDNSYRVSYIQRITVKYSYDGVAYQPTQDVTFREEMYDYEPTISDAKIGAQFAKNTTITIYVRNDNPNSFEITDRFTSDTTSFWSIFKYTFPVYLAILILFTWTFIQKEKEIKQQELFSRLK